jgi:hypothetical protein
VATGSHARDYQVTDYEAAVILPAKAMAMLAIDLLADGAFSAREVLSASKPAMTKAEYLTYMEGLTKVEEF